MNLEMRMIYMSLSNGDSTCIMNLLDSAPRLAASVFTPNPGAGMTISADLVGLAISMLVDW